jgi:hypothetical protein
VVQEPGKKLTYYFSGDFATSDIPYCTYRIKGIDKLKVLLYSDKLSDPRRFFWLYYKPLITGIFKEYYDNLKVK